jgi:hypothetical protein
MTTATTLHIVIKLKQLAFTGIELPEWDSIIAVHPAMEHFEIGLQV